MKKLILLTIFVFTLAFSSSASFAEWKKVSENAQGTAFFVDFDRIRQHEGYVYYWELQNFLKPDEGGNMSFKIYIQGDCNLFRFKFLSFTTHREPMGRGIAKNYPPSEKWAYPPPTSFGEVDLKAVCSAVK